MKKGGLVFLSIILALVIIAIGASAGALAYTNGVPAIKQTSVTAENTDDNSDSGYTSEDVADTQLTKSFDQFTVDNTMSPSEDKDKKDDDSDKKDGEEESTENKEDAGESSESSENSDDTTTNGAIEAGESKENSKNGEDSNNTEGTVTEEDKKEVKEEKKKSGTKYLFADSAKKKLNKKSAEALVDKIESKDYKMPGDRSVARMIINEMYAKHGAKFKDKEVQKYFNKKSWYKKIKKKVSTDKAFSKMSALEKKNIEVLDEIDKAN